MKKFDTHIHTRYSLCSLLRPEQVVDISAERGLSTIVVKDHNEIAGTLKARDYQEKAQKRVRLADGTYGEPLKVELGIEVRTECGELGIDFLTECELRKIKERYTTEGRVLLADLQEEVGKLKESKDSRMLVGLHHPFSYSAFSKRGGFDFYKACGAGISVDLEKGMVNIDKKDFNSHPFYSFAGLIQFIDYVELNANNLNPKEGRAAVILAKAGSKPVVLATDAHFRRMIGRHYTTALEEDVRNAIVSNRLEYSIPKWHNYIQSFYFRNKSGTVVRPARKMIRKVYSIFNLLKTKH